MKLCTNMQLMYVMFFYSNNSTNKLVSNKDQEYKDSMYLLCNSDINHPEIFQMQ